MGTSVEYQPFSSCNRPSIFMASSPQGSLEPSACNRLTRSCFFMESCILIYRQIQTQRLNTVPVEPDQPGFSSFLFCVFRSFRPSLAFRKSHHDGGGGSRTRVRNGFQPNIYMVSPLFVLAFGTSADGIAVGQLRCLFREVARERHELANPLIGASAHLAGVSRRDGLLTQPVRSCLRH